MGSLAPAICRSDLRTGPGLMCHGGQPDGWIVGDTGERFKRPISPCDHPFVVCLEHQGADEPDDGLVVRADADDDGAPLHLAVHALDRVRCAQVIPDPMIAV